MVLFLSFAVSGLRHLPSSSISSKKSCKSKRVRTIFTPEQLERLEVEFSRQQYMVGPERVYLAQTLQLTEAQVSVSINVIQVSCIIYRLADYLLEPEVKEIRKY